MARYYARRAEEFETVYLKPERQEDLASLRTLLQNLLRGQDVLELACGTGFWTEAISRTARSMLATDVNEELLALAREKAFPEGQVVLRKADAFTLEGIAGRFSAGFAGFWWSHAAKSRLPAFLEAFYRKLGRGALVVFADNNYVEGSSSPLSREDDEGNTYQKRRLKDGTEYEILKNFPSEAELRSQLCDAAVDIRLTNLTYYWCLSYRIKSAA